VTIAKDAVSSFSGSGTFSANHTPSGTPRGVIVNIEYANNADDVTSVTYGGETMTEATNSPQVRTASEAMVSHTYWLGASIPTGTQSVQVVSGGSITKYVDVITLTAADDMSEVDGQGNHGAPGAGDYTVTLSLGGDTAFAAVGAQTNLNHGGFISPLSGWTGDVETDQGSETSISYTYDTIGSSDVTAGVNIGSPAGANIAMTAIALKEGVGGELPFLPFFAKRDNVLLRM
jgi:hypothetical protein